MSESSPQREGPSEPPEASAESGALRSRLKELGYLQDPLARFISRPDRAQSLGASYVVAKVGVVFGALLFALLAAGFAAAGRYVLLDTRDLLLFHAYLLILALPLGVALGLLLAAFFALYSRLSRRALTKVALAARKCAVIVALAALGYLLLVWLRLRESLVDVGPITDLAVAMVCAGAAWLFGRAAFAAALYLGARMRRRDPLEIEPPKRGLYSLLALALLCAGGFAALLVAGRAEERLPREDFEVQGDARPVVVLGIDGLELASVETLAREGALPSFAALFTDGALCTLASGGPKHPFAWWTEIATGFPPERHGIAGPTHERPRGLSGSIFMPEELVGFPEVLEHVLPLLGLSRAVPFSAGLLQEKTLIEIASDAHLGAATVNWWMTHPVNPALDAWQLSELAIWQAWRNTAGATPQSNAAAPREIGALLARACVRPPLGAAGSERAKALQHASALDRSAIAVAEALLERPGLRYLQVGLWGPNSVHDAWRGGGGSLTDERARVAALTACYGEVDVALGRFRAKLARALPEAQLCVVVAPPTERDGGGPILRSDGWCVLLGSGLLDAAPRRGEHRTIDVAPTVLRLLGCPASAEMPGASFAEDLFGLSRRERISSFGPPALRPLPSVEEERDALEMIRAIGYL